MTRILLSCCILLFGLSLSAQEESAQEFVYLKDGSFLVGKVLEQTPNTLTFRTSYGIIQEIPQMAVERIRTSNRKQLFFPNGKSLQTHGWFGLVELQFLPGSEENPWTGRFEPRLGSSLTLSGGYQYGQLLALEANLGFDLYRDLLLVAGGLGVRSYLTKGPVAPYLRLQTGYSWALFDAQFVESNGGTYIHPSVGLRFASRSNSELHMDVGYRFQRLVTEGGNFTEDRRFRRLSLRIGLLF